MNWFKILINKNIIKIILLLIFLINIHLKLNIIKIGNEIKLNIIIIKLIFMFIELIEFWFIKFIFILMNNLIKKKFIIK